MQRGHAREAMVSPYENWKGYYAWILKNPRPIVPFPMKGKLSLWECDHAVEYLLAPTNPHALRSYCETYWNDFLRDKHSHRQVNSLKETEGKHLKPEKTMPDSNKQTPFSFWALYLWRGFPILKLEKNEEIAL